MTKRGKKAAGVASEELKLSRALEDRIDLEDARKALKDIKKQGTVSWKKIKSELGM